MKLTNLFDEFVGFCAEHGKTLVNHRAFGESSLELRKALVELEAREAALFALYLEHIHEHRLGAIPADECSSCINLVNNLIKAKIDETSQ